MTEASEDLTFRNLFRQHVLTVADGLEQGTLSTFEGAEQLKELCESDIREMDEADIEVDFDISDKDIGGLLAIGSLASNTPAPQGDPVETALTRCIGLRDRINGLRIVACEPGETDLDAYKAALRDLRDALNASILD